MKENNEKKCSYLKKNVCIFLLVFVLYSQKLYDEYDMGNLWNLQLTFDGNGLRQTFYSLFIKKTTYRWTIKYP